MAHELRQIGKALDYKKIERVIAVSERDGIDVVNTILQNSIRDTFAMIFFEASMIQITPYGIVFSMTYKSTNVGNYLTMHPELNEKYLRTVFTGFELLLYKLAHICLEKHAHDYQWESERTRRRFSRLCKLLKVHDEKIYKDLFDEIFFVRDAFAHSFVDVDKIKYRGAPLSQCFGQSWVGRSYAGASAIFIDDLNALYAPVMDLFMAHQFEQFDASKFARLCNSLVNTRSLGPGH